MKWGKKGGQPRHNERHPRKVWKKTGKRKEKKGLGGAMEGEAKHESL